MTDIYSKTNKNNGYIYAFKNDCMPNIFKIGMTTRNPEIRLLEANSTDTWRPPCLYEIAFAKKVNNPKEKENILHTILSKNGKRVNDKREFFNIYIDELKLYFDLIDGDYYNPANNNNPMALKNDTINDVKIIIFQLFRRKLLRRLFRRQLFRSLKNDVKILISR